MSFMMNMMNMMNNSFSRRPNSFFNKKIKIPFNDQYECKDFFLKLNCKTNYPKNIFLILKSQK